MHVSNEQAEKPYIGVRKFKVIYATQPARPNWGNLFEYTGTGKMLWLQRWCFALLRKLGATAPIRVEIIRIEPDRLIDRLLLQRSIAEQFNSKPTRLIIGSKTYSDLMGELRDIGPMQAYGTYLYNEHGRETVIGMSVEIVPWLDGVLVLP